jgi:hydrogenase maturation protease
MASVLCYPFEHLHIEITIENMIQNPFTLPPFLLFAIGNESRGDDAIAPLLLRKLEASLKIANLEGQFEFLEDFQLQVEHATDMLGRELVLFIDAGLDTPAPFSFYRIRNNDSCTLFSHAITPEAVLSTFKKIYQQEPPPAFVLCVCGEQFELGASPSPAAEEHMKSAMKLLLELARTASESSWEERCN